MKIKILDKKIANGKSWFLGKISLWDYLSSVTDKNFEYDIQRGIVKNRYLDSILQSVNKGEALPPITIVVDKYENEDMYINIADGTFNILDGLQRTYRLWLYKKISEISAPTENLFGGKQYDITNIVSTLKKSPYYIPGVISVSQVKSLLDDTMPINVSSIEEIYRQFDIYLYVWAGLNDKEIVQKMLILNAGQRRVSIGHQYELMFLQIFKDKEITDKVHLAREKDENFGVIKVGKRNIGEFIFSSTIIGIQSLIAGEPIRLSAENLEYGKEDEYISEELVNRYFNQPFLNIYLESLYKIDEALCQISETYLKWIVKDTTISGIMGAIGAFLKLGNNNDFNLSYGNVINFFVQKINEKDCFEIECFYKEYSNLSSQKINIGDKVRNAIFTYTLGILKNSPIKWAEAFTNKEELS